MANEKDNEVEATSWRKPRWGGRVSGEGSKKKKRKSSQPLSYVWLNIYGCKILTSRVAKEGDTKENAVVRSSCSLVTTFDISTSSRKTERVVRQTHHG